MSTWFSKLIEKFTGKKPEPQVAETPVVTEPAPVVEKPKAKKPTKKRYSAAELEALGKLKKSELVAKAKEKGIEVTTKMTKAVLVEAIKKAGK